MTTLTRLLAAMALSTLPACGNAADVPAAVNDNCDKACEVTIEYEGRPLHCITWLGSHGEIGYTCDFRPLPPRDHFAWVARH